MEEVKQINLDFVKRALANSTTERARFRIDNYSNLDEFILLVYQSICEEDGSFEADEQLLANIRAVCRWLRGELKVSVMMSGQCGNGKTTMIKALRKAIPMMTGNKFYVTFVSARELAEMAQNSEQDFKRAMRADILALDDVGAEPSMIKHYGNEISPTTDVIYYRYDNRLPTILSTNLRKADIQNVYGERIADRINGFCTNIVFKQKSYRR